MVIVDGRGKYIYTEFIESNTARSGFMVKNNKDKIITHFTKTESKKSNGSYNKTKYKIAIIDNKSKDKNDRSSPSIKIKFWTE